MEHECVNMALIERLRNEIERLRIEMEVEKNNIKAVKEDISDMKADIKEVKTNIINMQVNMNAGFDSVKTQNIVLLGGVIITLIGLICSILVSIFVK